PGRDRRRRRRRRQRGLLRPADLIATKDPQFRTMQEELFGPVVTTYVYPEGKWSDTLGLVESTSPYGLTGAVFSEDRSAIDEAEETLRYAAGNFYVNDKPTGAVV